MQMAMVSTAQKPTQRERLGEFLEGLPGSTKSVACVKRNVKNPSASLRAGFGRPDGFLNPEVHWEFVHHRKETGRLHRNIK